MPQPQNPDSDGRPPAGAPRVGIVVGNPKPASRTFHAARHLAEQLADRAPDPAVDLASFGPGLLDWSDTGVDAAVEAVRGLDLVVFASPTYKASYTGLLKVFLDRFPSNALDGVVAVPLMLGAGPGHALAPEVFLRPVLAELGASIPAKALYLIDADHDRPEAYEPWLAAARGRIAAALHGRRSATDATGTAGVPDAVAGPAPDGAAGAR